MKRWWRNDPEPGAGSMVRRLRMLRLRDPQHLRTVSDIAFLREIRAEMDRVAVGGETLIITSMGHKRCAVLPIDVFEALLDEHRDVAAAEGVAIDRTQFFAEPATAAGGSYRVYAHGTGPGATDGD